MKTGLRARLLAQRDALTTADRVRFSDAITRALVSLDAYQRARSVLAYMTFGSEFMTDRFIAQVLGDGKSLWLPRINRAEHRLSLHAVRDTHAELAAGPWGIREPMPGLCAAGDIADIEFALVPGLGFSCDGARLGYGRGYYDRLLERRDARTALVAGAYAMQLVDHIPADGHDVPMQLVVTETGTYGPSAGSAVAVDRGAQKTSDD